VSIKYKRFYKILEHKQKHEKHEKQEKHKKHKNNMRGAFVIFNITFSTGFILHWVINL